jgi:hypothetical protein
MPYIGNQPAQLGAYAVESFNGGGSSFTLSKSATTETVLLFIDGVRQTPTDAYSVSGTTLTTTATTPSGTNNVTVQFLGDVVDFGEPSDNSVTSTKIVDGTIVNADINASAAIALSKLATDPSNASNLSSGTVPTARLASGTADSTTFLRGDQIWAEAGGGKVLQVVQGTQSTGVSTTGTTYVTSNLSASITPSSTSNKILVIVHINAFYAEGTNAGGYIALYRGGSVLVNDAARIFGTGDSLGSLVINHLDSPSSTSSLTYTVYFKRSSGTIVSCHTGNVQSNIVLMEIAG